MGTYDIQQVCSNGHQITDSYNRFPEFRRDFCPECGEKTISHCPSCEREIRGEYYTQGMWSAETSVPTHCEYCGDPYPWTRLIQANPKTSPNTITSDKLDLIELVCDRFHLVATQLRKRYGARPALEISDEYDVQYLLHALLKVHFDDVRPEEWTPSHGGASSRVDFLLKNEQIVIEVKMTRKSLTDKLIGNELIVDKERYKSHPNCKDLVCFVYDPESLISNPRGLESDLNSNSEELKVRVLVVPRGQQHN